MTKTKYNKYYKRAFELSNVEHLFLSRFELAKLAMKYIETGIKYGFSPWSCDGTIEYIVFETLNTFGEYPQKTMEETLAFYKINNVC